MHGYENLKFERYSYLSEKEIFEAVSDSMNISGGMDILFLNTRYA